MPQDDARELLSNILDRCAAMLRPFWEVSVEERAEVALRLGSPIVMMRVGQDSDADLRVAGGAVVFLGLRYLPRSRSSLRSRRTRVEPGKRPCLRSGSA